MVKQRMIPRLLNHVWPGNDEFRPKFHAWRASWMRFNPDYSFRFWNLDNLPFDLMTPACARIIKSNLCYVSKGDLIRHIVIYLYGGIYVDTDMECIKNFDPLLKCSAFVGEGNLSKYEIPNAVMACEKGNAMFGEIIDVIAESIINNWEIWNDPKRLYKEADGSMQQLSRQYFKKNKNCVVYPTEYFYPFDYDTPMEERRKTDLSRSFAVHHWNGTDPVLGWAQQGNSKIIKDGMR